jgi:collagen type VII alpha
MASSGYTTLQLYHTETPGVEPAAGNLIAGELAINTADGKLFYKNTSGTVSTITSGGGSGGSGYSGYSGYSGLGLSGYSGYSGQNGASASSGYSGYSGQTGASGISGYSGSGISGFSGYSGAGGGGSVTSVNASGGVTGLTFSGGPITTSGTLTLGGTLVISGGGTNTQTTPTAGGVAFGTGTAYAFTTVGTTGQFLTSNAASNPTWASLSKSNVTDALGYTPPTPTGTGATGTWPINISGLAASASYATAAGTATTASNPASGGSFITSNNISSQSVNFATSAGSVTNGVYTNAANIFSGSATFNTTVGNQVVTVSGAGQSTGLSPGSIQLGASGFGMYYSTSPQAVNIITPGFGGNAAFYNTGYNYQGNNNASWQTTSDINIKTNIHPITNVLEKINALNPTHFEYKDKLGETRTGFIAQEYETVFPGHVTTEAISEKYKKFMPAGATTIKSINTDLIPYLVKAVQELSAEIATLKATK